jgi:hypothetical protein
VNRPASRKREPFWRLVARECHLTVSDVGADLLVERGVLKAQDHDNQAARVTALAGVFNIVPIPAAKTHRKGKS